MRRILIGALATLTLSTPAFAAKEKTCDIRRTGQRKPVHPKLRESAQKGLDYLVRESLAWTKKHKCYGCHVQAVTLEGLTVGRHNQYRVSSKDVQAMAKALLLGVTAGGRKTGAAFQGAAWARYDQWIDDEQTGSLLKYARELITYQDQAGAVQDDDRRPPVVAGTMQTTFQAMQTWRQAYARTADDVWLGPMRKAEGFLMRTARKWSIEDEVSILDLNYALMGLVAAGVKRNEPTSRKLQRMLLGRQHSDGAFGLQMKKKDALATGQSLYALKLVGYSDRDASIAKGMRWLIAKQAKNGGWKTVSSNQNGADKGEAMWAVLGLVSVDVMSIAVEGIRDGQRVAKFANISAEAVDNQSGGIKQLEMLVDDLPVKAECGSKTSHRLDVTKLPHGKHFIDIIATNAAGKTSARRVEFYVGDFYMTHVGTRYDERRKITEISLRNIADSSAAAGKIRVEIKLAGKKTGIKAKTVFSKELKGEVGPMTIEWNGMGSDGKPKPTGRYTAHLSFVDGQGKVRQVEKTVFLHNSLSVQQDTYGEVQGRIRHKKGNDAAEAIIDLVDKDGKVVQSTRSTAQGNYRFKNVDEGRYKVRVRKRGFKSKESEVMAAPRSAPATADMEL